MVYGIPNCDSTQKALNWLKSKKLAFHFHDYKLLGITKDKLESWCEITGWEILFNKRSTTWKGLSIADQQKANGQTGAIEIMLKHNSIIKRPIVETGKELLVGYNEEIFRKHFKLK